MLRPSFAGQVVLAVAGMAALTAPIIRAQSAASTAPKFEVASVRPCREGDTGPGGKALAKGGGKGSGGGGSFSPGRLNMGCFSMWFLIHTAYVDFANGQFATLQPVGSRIEGLPEWAKSESYIINAKAEGNASQVMMRGPMLQALLEDRFKLKVHHETRDVPVYELTVAKSGLSLKKMQPTVEGSCTPRDLTRFPTPPLQPGQKPWCMIRPGVNPGRATFTFDALGTTMAELAQRLGSNAGRPVLDKTGLTGMFDFHLEFSATGSLASDASDDPPAAPSIFTALGALGLKLQPAKGPVEFLVIDHVERPSAN